MLLSDILATAGYAQGRATITLLQALCGRSSNNILLSLGSLHRSCLWENIVLNAGLQAQGIIDASSAAISGAATPAVVENENAEPEENSVSGAAGPSSIDTSATQGALAAAPIKKSVPQMSGPRFQNATAFKHITHGIPNALAPFFQGEIICEPDNLGMF